MLDDDNGDGNGQWVKGSYVSLCLCDNDVWNRTMAITMVTVNSGEILKSDGVFVPTTSSIL